jgi:hypothetical protein
MIPRLCGAVNHQKRKLAGYHEPPFTVPPSNTIQHRQARWDRRSTVAVDAQTLHAFASLQNHCFEPPDQIDFQIQIDYSD